MADEKREFARNHENCFIGIPVKHPEDYRAFAVKGVNSDGTIGGTVISRNGKETAYRFNYEATAPTIRPIVPSAGYFNVCIKPPDSLGLPSGWYTALFVDVAPDRQFRKGLAGDVRYVVANVSGSPHFSDIWKKLHTFAGASGHNYFENKMLASHLAAGGGRDLVTLRQAIDMVESGHHCTVAFSKFFAATLRPNLAYPAIVSGNELVGVYAQGSLWATDKLMPLADFFDKRWGVRMFHIADYKKRDFL